MTHAPAASHPPLVIWGASGHARVVADIVRLAGEFRIAGFIDNVDPSRRGEEFCGARVLGGREQLQQLHEQGIGHVIMAFGNCRARVDLAREAREYGFQLATAIHPRAVIASDVRIGGGTVVMAGTVINPGTVLGENVIINTSASVDHDCVVEDGVHIGPGAHLGGGVVVRTRSWIGIGASIKDKITIGRDTIVGAGAVVLKDIPDEVVAYGVPARVIRSNKD